MAGYRRRAAKPKGDPALRPAPLLRYFRGKGHLMLAEHDGSLWVTEKYMAARLEGSALDRMADLLALYNLTVEPMVCEVGSTIIRNDATPPDVGKVIPAPAHQAKRFLIGTSPVLVDSPMDGGGLQLWEANGRRVCLQPSIMSMVDRLAIEGEWFVSAKEHAPLVKIHNDRPVAAVMPVRHMGVPADEEAAA